MATTIRRLALGVAWLTVTLVAVLPIVGVILGVWPSVFFDWQQVADFFAYTGLLSSIANTMVMSTVAPLIALYVAFMIYSQYRFDRRWRALEQRLAPLLSLPHLAVALGLVYLFSPSGVFWSSLWGVFGQSPPNWLGLPRKDLITMIVAISLKEVPFFLLIFSAVGRQLAIKDWLRQGRALGYSEHASWWLLVFPAIVKQSRLALLAAMAYCLSVLDVTLLVGPNIPELFAVALYHWQTGFSTAEQAMATLGNLTMLLMLVVLIATIYLHEKWAVARWRHHATMASPLRAAKISDVFKAWFGFFSLLSLAIILTFFVWSVGGINLAINATKSSPSWTLSLWQSEWFFLQAPLLNSLIIGMISGVLGGAIALLALELQRRCNRYLPDYIWLMAILLPQLTMVYGWQLLHTSTSGSYSVMWVAASHLPFTFAYSYLVLRGPFQSLNLNYERVAASFGYSYWQRCWKIRFMLLRPALLGALAIAFSVSVTQYITTLMIGAGRVITITTEAVAVASGNERSLTAMYMLVQAMLPFVVFLIARILAQRIRGSTDVTHQ